MNIVWVPNGVPCCDFREVPRQEAGDIQHMLEMSCCQHKVDKIFMEELFVALAQIRDAAMRRGGSSQEVSRVTWTFEEVAIHCM